VAVRNESFQLLLNLLVHPFPKVRKLAAEQTYIRIMTDEYLVPKGSLDDILNVLLQTKWDQKRDDDLESKRDRLYRLLEI